MHYFVGGLDTFKGSNFSFHTIKVKFFLQINSTVKGWGKIKTCKVQQSPPAFLPHKGAGGFCQFVN